MARKNLKDLILPRGEAIPLDEGELFDVLVDNYLINEGEFSYDPTNFGFRFSETNPEEIPEEIRNKKLMINKHACRVIRNSLKIAYKRKYNARLTFPRHKQTEEYIARLELDPKTLVSKEELIGLAVRVIREALKKEEERYHSESFS
jgi:hypothetical protein